MSSAVSKMAVCSLYNVVDLYIDDLHTAEDEGYIAIKLFPFQVQTMFEDQAQRLQLRSQRVQRYLCMEELLK